MNVIIPLAGFGTRLRPHTHTMPKVLLHVAGKPIVGGYISRLPSSGIAYYTQRRVTAALIRGSLDAVRATGRAHGATVNDVLLAVGDVARDRWRDLSPVARGLVVLVAREILEYRRGRRAVGRPPRVSPVTGRARRPRRPGRAL